MQIQILGNIGAGKTELAKTIARRMEGFTGIFESDVAHNPYLTDFIECPSAYALHNQLYFLTTAVESVNAHKNITNYVQDFCILGCPLFAEAMMIYGSLSQRDFNIYERLCISVVKNLPRPSLYIIVTAKVETLSRRIMSRGRESESAIPTEYLEILQSLHETKLMKFWLNNLDIPVLEINTDDYDLLQSDGVESILSQIKAYI